MISYDVFIEYWNVVDKRNRRRQKIDGGVGGGGGWIQLFTIIEPIVRYCKIYIYGCYMYTTEIKLGG